MITIRLNSHFDEFRRELRQATAEGLQRAGVYLHRQCVQAVSKSAGPKSFKRKRNTVAGKKGSRYTKFMRPSKPGESPHARTGHGRSSIVFEFNGSQVDPRVRVGVRKNAIYMAYLELGTRRVRPRPWLKSMLDRHRATLVRLALAKFN